MGSLNKNVESTLKQNTLVAFRPAQRYFVAAPGPLYTLFNINNGPIEILELGGMETLAATGGTDLRLRINTVTVDAAAVAINGGVGFVFLSCLNVAGTLVNALGIPKTDALLHSKGFVAGLQAAGPGLVTATFGTGTDWVGEFFMVYRQLNPNALVTVA